MADELTDEKIVAIASSLGWQVSEPDISRDAVELVRAVLAALPAPAGEPAMPEPVGHVHSTGDFCQDRPIPATEWPAYLNTADQLRAYGDARAEHARREAERAIATKDRQLDSLLQHCPDAECMVCSEIMCPHGEPLHFHHDGCPACYQQENTR